MNDYKRNHDLLRRFGVDHAVLRSSFPMTLLSAVLAFGFSSQALLAVPVPITSGLVLHLDAQNSASVRNGSNLPASNGENVATWIDDALSNDATPNAGAGPVFNTTGAPNMLPTLDFGGTTNLVSGSVSARTVVLFHRWDSAGAPRYLMDFRNGINSSYAYTGGLGGNWTFYVDDSTTAGTGIGDLMNGNWQVSTFVGANAGSDVMRIMSRFSDNEFGIGAVSEILVYDQVLSEAERLELFTFLDEKWVNLPPVIPEPSSFALCGLGAVGLCSRRRRRRP